MGQAVETEIKYVGREGCRPFVYDSMWDVLCNQLFTQLPPPGIGEVDTFQQEKVWQEGEIAMTKTTYPYTFTIQIDTDRPPRPADIIYFGKDNYYIIGKVDADGDIYTCSGCVSIDTSIIGAYASMSVLNKQASQAETGRVDAEDERDRAERGRADAEDERVAAESARSEAFTASQNARTLAYQEAEGTEGGSTAGDGSRWGAFKAAENSRIEQMAALLAPWVVPGAVVADNNHFVEDDEQQTAVEGKTRWDAGFRVHLVNRAGRTEQVVADDGECLITLSGWKWYYAE